MDDTIREGKADDWAAMARLWNDSAAAGEVVYAPLAEAAFTRMLDRPGKQVFIAEGAQGLTGWIHGMAGTDTGENGYLTAVIVTPDARRQGVGTALLRTLLDRFAQLGKTMAVVSGDNPVKITWRVPGTDGHDHNNAPGVDEDSAGYPFLLARGFAPQFREVSMHRALTGYAWPEARMEAIRQRLHAEGITAGLYDGKSELEFDGMCDRVGSEYWRNVLRQELAAWREGRPCADETLWVDGERPTGPRPLLVAVHDGHIVGFTGPVAVQRSGRGWFTGICVDPDYGRRQIGALLFEMLLREFARQGATFSTLFTGAENHAQRIYQRAGMAVVRRFTVMTKPLREGVSYEKVHF